MQFKCGKTDEERAAERKARYDEAYRLATTWTKRFAWLPTTIRPGKCVWLEDYERQLESVYDGWRTRYEATRMAYAVEHKQAREVSWRLREITK